MKTANEVKQEIAALIEQSKHMHKDTPDYKKNQGRVLFLNKCLQYLEGEPREDFVIKMQSDLLNKKKLIDNGFDDWRKFNGDVSIEKRKSTYSRQVGLSEINSQLKTIKYILS